MPLIRPLAVASLALIASLLVGPTAIAATGTVTAHVNCNGTRGDAQFALRWGHRDFHQNEYFPIWKVHCPGTNQIAFPMADQWSEFEIQTEGGHDTTYEMLVYIDPGDGKPAQPSIELRHTKGPNANPPIVTRGVTVTRSAGPNDYGEQNYRVDLSSVQCAVPTLRSSFAQPLAGSHDAFVAGFELAAAPACHPSGDIVIYPAHGDPIVNGLRIPADGVGKTAYSGYSLPARAQMRFRCAACAFPKDVDSPSFSLPGAPAPVIARFQAYGNGKTADAPDLLYVPPGTPITLYWTVAPCGNDCTATIEAFGGLNYSERRASWPGLPLSSSQPVKPSDTFTKYRLTAATAAASSVSEVIVQFSR